MPDAPDDLRECEERRRQLAEALRCGLEFRAAGRDDVEAFLAEHEDLEELLAPMLCESAAHAELGDEIEGDGDAVEREHAFAPGTRFGDFAIERELDRGGMGIVFAAVQISLGRRVALKVLSTPEGLGSERRTWRFQREARLLAELDHRGIVRIFGSGREHGRLYYAMELVAGAPLSAVIDALRRAGLQGASGATIVAAVAGAECESSSPERAWSVRSYVESIVDLGAQVAAALAFAHAAGIVHRDVKPANVLVRRDGRALLSDFGIARREGAPEITRTGDVAGTPCYMSPEQATGAKVDHRTDIYSLGVVLYEALTLQRPFDGASLAERLRCDEPPDPSRLHAAIGADLSAVVRKAMAKDPRDRYASAGDLGADLRACLEGRPVSVRRPRAWKRFARWARREPWKAATLGVAALGAAALAVVSFGFAERLWREGERTRDALAEVNRLALGVKLEQAEAAAEHFVARPETMPAMELWLRDLGEPLAQKLKDLRQLLTDVRARALPYGPREADADRASHPDAERMRLLEAELAFRRERLARGAASSSDIDPREMIALLEQKQAELKERIAARRTWEFREPETQFLHAQVAALVARVERFAEAEQGALQRVRALLARVRESTSRTLSDAASAWREAAAAIACSPRYGGLRIAPQAGLLPLGPDPTSQCWEFVHLLSGEREHEVPSRNEQGRILPDAEMGIVFVLLPGARFAMGAQSADPNAANYDELASEYEGPVHEVEIAPFFLAKYELTQAQWLRLTGDGRPSFYSASKKWGGPAVIGYRNPVESVSFVQCRDLMARYALALPTEAQWEYACRAGSEGPWSFLVREAAPRHANFVDLTVGRYTSFPHEDLDDGYLMHAPVGSFEPNAFGLHDMHGNVSEWVHDVSVAYSRPLRADGHREVHYSDVEVIAQRGGGHSSTLSVLRTTSRQLSNGPNYRADNLGLRAARAIDP